MAGHTRAADRELRSANQYQKSARKRACWLTLILVIILTVVLLAVSTKSTKADKTGIKLNPRERHHDIPIDLSSLAHTSDIIISAGTLHVLYASGYRCVFYASVTANPN